MKFSCLLWTGVVNDLLNLKSPVSHDQTKLSMVNLFNQASVKSIDLTSSLTVPTCPILHLMQYRGESSYTYVHLTPS